MSYLWKKISRVFTVEWKHETRIVVLCSKHDEERAFLSYIGVKNLNPMKTFINDNENKYNKRGFYGKSEEENIITCSWSVANPNWTPEVQNARDSKSTVKDTRTKHKKDIYVNLEDFLSKVSCIVLITDPVELKTKQVKSQIDQLNVISPKNKPRLLVLLNQRREKLGNSFDPMQQTAFSEWNEITKCIPCNISTGVGLENIINLIRKNTSDTKQSQYEKWLNEAAQEHEKNKGKSAIQRSTPQQYLLALGCLFFALMMRIVIRKYFSKSNS